MTHSYFFLERGSIWWDFLAPLVSLLICYCMKKHENLENNEAGNASVFNQKLQLFVECLASHFPMIVTVFFCAFCSSSNCSSYTTKSLCTKLYIHTRRGRFLGNLIMTICKGVFKVSRYLLSSYGDRAALMVFVVWMTCSRLRKVLKFAFVGCSFWRQSL